MHHATPVWLSERSPERQSNKTQKRKGCVCPSRLRYPSEASSGSAARWTLEKREKKMNERRPERSERPPAPRSTRLQPSTTVDWRARCRGGGARFFRGATGPGAGLRGALRLRPVPAARAPHLRPVPASPRSTIVCTVLYGVPRAVLLLVRGRGLGTHTRRCARFEVQLDTLAGHAIGHGTRWTPGRGVLERTRRPISGSGRAAARLTVAQPLTSKRHRRVEKRPDQCWMT